MLLGPFLGLALPLLPGQILWVNLMTHGLPGVAIRSEVAEPDIARRPPRRPEEGILTPRTAIETAVLGALVTACCLALWARSAGMPWQTMLFVTLALDNSGSPSSRAPTASHHGGCRRGQPVPLRRGRCQRRGPRGGVDGSTSGVAHAAERVTKCRSSAPRRARSPQGGRRRHRAAGCRAATPRPAGCRCRTGSRRACRAGRRRRRRGTRRRGSTLGCCLRSIRRTARTSQGRRGRRAGS